MRKKNTRLGMAIGYIALAISGFFAVIGAVADLFGFAQGVADNKESILGIIGTVLSFLVRWWKGAVIVVVIVAVIIILIRFTQKKELEDRQTRNLSWFDAQRRNTKYSGGEEYLYELKHFLKQDGAGLSWWAVTGVAGMGKTRLVIEALRDEKLKNADVQWIRSFDDYREDALKARVNESLERPNLRNIIIAEDAQIYMDNIGVLLGYIAEKPVAELGRHKFRVLLVIRTGEDENLKDRYKQLASKTRQSILQKTRFNAFEEELRIAKYSEEDISQIVKTYVVSTKKNRKKGKALLDDQMVEIQTKTIQVLKSEKIDPGHLRPLFAMFIADAMLEGKDPMEWDRISVLEYAVIEREEELLQLEARDIQRNDNFRVFDKIRCIICLSFIRDGIALSELDDIKKELEEELRNDGTSLMDFLTELQILRNDGIICLSMPDILSEYYVLRLLVIKPDEVIVNWIIRQLCTSLDGAEVFRQKIRQDFRFLYNQFEEQLDDFYYVFFEQCSSDRALEIIEKLLLEQDLRDSNDILLHEAIGNQIRNKANEEHISIILFSMLIKTPELEEKRRCIAELERLSGENEDNITIVRMYVHGLNQMIEMVSDIEEKRSYLEELEHLSEEVADNAEIKQGYAFGLVKMIEGISGIEEKRNCLEKLERMYGENADNEIKKMYFSGLDGMIEKVPDIEEKRSYLEKLKRMYGENTDDSVIVSSYANGLYSMISNAPVDIEEKRWYTAELERLYRESECKQVIALLSSSALPKMLRDDPNMDKKRCYLMDLELRVRENTGLAGISYGYARGLLIMFHYAHDIEEKRSYLVKLEHLAREYADEDFIVCEYAKGIFNMILDIPDVEEKRRYLTELKHLAGEYSDKSSIILVYAQGLATMLSYDGGYIDDYSDDYIDELHRILSNKEHALYIAKKDPNIITFTRRELLDYEFESKSYGIDIMSYDINTILDKNP